MAAKKRAGKGAANAKQQTFQSSPFSAMKGLCVSSETPEDNATKPQSPEPEVVAEPEQDADFASVMGNIGVKRLENQGGLFAEEEGGAEGDSRPDKESSSSFIEDELNDDDLFLHHLGQMDAVFSDDYPDTDSKESQSGSARRMRQLRKGHLRPEACLDLHGCYREEARKMVRTFLENRQRAGMKTVLIITGRGQRSRGGEPILRADIETYLRTKAKAWVAEWGRAPKQYGGDGALVVFLRN